MQYLNYLSFILFLLNAFSCNAKSVGFAIVVFILLPFFLLVQFLSFDTQEACYQDRTYLDIGSTEKTFGKYRSLSCYSGLLDMCGT